MDEKSNLKTLVFIITKSNWGGAQRYVFDLCVAMREKFLVKVILGGDGPLAEKLNGDGIEVITIAELGRDVNFVKDFKAGWKIWRALLKIKPDIVHLNSSKIGAVGSLAARLAFVPKIIFTAHGWAFNENRSPLQKTLIAFIAWLTLVFSHKTIAVSEAIKKQIIYFPFIKNRIVVVPLGIAPIEYFQKEEAQQKLLGSTLDKDFCVIGSVGELHPIKGHGYAIEAVAGLISKGKKIKYVICGEGAYRPILEKKIKDLQEKNPRSDLVQNIILAGNLPEAARYLKAFDIFLFPSLSEASGYAALEAGMAGLPIIASAVGGVPEIIDDMISGILIQPEKPNEIVAAVELLLDKPELQQKYGSALREKVMKDFSVERMVRETENVYKKVKSQPTSAR
jgi:glycosyltransferase involved in cell wall biosynthesis